MTRPDPVLLITGVTGASMRRRRPQVAPQGATNFAETPRRELPGTGVEVTLRAPEPVVMFFAGSSARSSPAPALTPDDVARAVLFALHQPSGVDPNEILIRPHGATA